MTTCPFCGADFYGYHDDAAVWECGTSSRSISIDRDANCYERELSAVRQQRDNAAGELRMARAVIDRRLCRKHAESPGLLGYDPGNPNEPTPAGAGFVMCAGIRVQAEAGEIELNP